MKRLFTSIIAALATAIAAFAYEPAIRDIDIVVKIQHDGTISIHERWDVTAASGTEWYLVRNNLADIRIQNFAVSENGREFVNEGEWDVDRGINAKAHKCGIVTKSNGAELCWGVGNYGDHVFDVYYDMTNAVKSLQDYDMLHIQFVGTGLSSTPEHVKVSVEIPDVQIDTSNARIWGFGYEGRANFIDGKVVFESTERFQYMSSIISLIRLNKGILEPTSIQDRPFQDALDTAMEGAYFGNEEDDEEDDLISSLLGLGILVYIFYLFSKGGSRVSKKQKKAILGCDPKMVTWTRELPFNGDLLKAEYTLKSLGNSSGDSNYTSALILRLVQRGYLIPCEKNGEMELRVSDRDTRELDDVEAMFLGFMKEAAGRNDILERSEFKTWASSHTSAIRRWSNKITSEAKSSMVYSGELNKMHKYTPEGQEQARRTLGFKAFLKDFTLVSERSTPEVVLWQDYLAFGALYGIAEKVASELKQINPDLFKQAATATVAYDMDSLIRLSKSYRDTVRSNSYESSSGGGYSGGSSGGFGGSSSFGGGGGFSGGGHGGGSR